MSATINVTFVDGRRKPLRFDDDQILVTVRDGNLTYRARQFFSGPAVPVPVEFFGSPRDRHTVLASLKGCRDAGCMAIEPARDGDTVQVQLMMVPKKPTFTFAPFATVQTDHPRLFTLLSQSLDPANPAAHYETLTGSSQPQLACLCNIVEAMDQIDLPRDPENRGSFAGYLDRIDLVSRPDQVLNPDRVFVWARRSIVDVMSGLVASHAFEPALATLHPGATNSFKQTAFNESNLQVTLHEKDIGSPGGVDLVKVELDIDYFRDSVSHLLLEVTANALKRLAFGGKSSQSLTDPALAYVLRWTAGQRAGAKRPFAPAFVLA